MAEGDNKITPEVLQRYTELEKKIHEMEGKNVRMQYLELEKQLAVAENEVKSYEAVYQNCVKQTEIEKKDVDDLNASVKIAVMNKDAFNEKMSKEQAEYVEAVTKQEHAAKELEKAKQLAADLKAVQESQKGEYETLEKMSKERDEILSSIFNGEYGSEKENQLEADLDLKREKKQRVEVAHYKWKNSKVLLETAVKQLGHGVKKWMDSGRLLPPDGRPLAQQQMQGQYNVATECRNNFIAGRKNIDSCQKYLDNIKFPYCDPNELITLQKAVDNIYVDMQTLDRHKHAYNCYNVTYRRAAALKQWVDMVVANVIEKDLKNVIMDANKIEKELRMERIRLLKEKVEQSGQSADFADADMADEDDKVAEAELAAMFKPEVTPEDSGSNLTVDDDIGPAPTPMPQGKLAAAPCEKDMFGDMEQLKKDYESNMMELKKTHDANKMRVDQGLEEKLAARRMRRRQP